jgi:hypothetical protein
MLTSSPAAEHARIYRDHLTAFGELVTLRKSGAADIGNIRARITGYRPEEIVGGIEAGHRRAILLAEDLTVKPAKNDRIVLQDGTALVVLSVDGSTRKVGSTLLAYECQVAGAA